MGEDEKEIGITAIRGHYQKKKYHYTNCKVSIMPRDAEAGSRKLVVPLFKLVSYYQYPQFCRKPNTI
ncbi:MAG: hypothetical protein CM1200mP30_19730 [Pseudomonadota bacterium]|nr:MAG: hypothetical protein CM1200mP30_19730 [Pseudomonadota bacterium]